MVSFQSGSKLFGCLFVCFCIVSANDEEAPNGKFFFWTTRPWRPTSAIVHHEPGLPPGWTKAPPRPSRWFIGDEVNPEAGEVIVESQVINITKPQKPINKTEDEQYPPGVEPPEASLADKDKNLVDWVFGLFKPSPKPEEIVNPTIPVLPTKCKHCSCGISYKHNRIVGGVVTKVNAYPWVAYLTYNNRFYCGASVINDRYLLTAAHCITGFTKEKLTAILLDHDRSTTSETKIITRKIQTILKHGNYNVGGSYNNDIALLKLDQSLDFGDLLHPVCLPEKGKTYTGQTGIVTGWGATESHGQVSNKLREVEVPIISLDACKKTGYQERITENMICAGYDRGMKDSCQGDSGGPLHVLEGQRYKVAGVVSWGEGCALANYPGVYTRVNRYISWIMSNTRDACYCD